MNILIDDLPEMLTICGQNCAIRTDFRTWIRFTLLAFENNSIAKKSVEIIKLIFIDMPPNLVMALRGIMSFYNPNSDDSKKADSKKPVKMYDFDYDADAIYSAFKQQYNIDLREAELHWYEFKALLDNLTEDTRFIKTVGYRAVDLSEIKSDEMRKFYSKMKSAHALPDKRPQEQIDADFSRAFVNAFMKTRK